MIVQIPAADRGTVLGSEAFEDMKAQADNLTSRRKDAQLAILSEDPSRYLEGLGPSAELRTIFVGRGGRSLIFEGLFLDDPKPVEDFLDGAGAAHDLPEELAVKSLEFRPGACRDSGPRKG